MKEYDIRPKGIFDEYLRLTEADTATYFSDCVRNNIACPACGTAGVHAFDKAGFGYAECPDCLTLFASPRPSRHAFDQYYKDSPSTEFWATTFYRETEQARRQLIWKPKAAMIHEKLCQFSEVDMIIDIGGGYGTFAEEIKKIGGYDVTIVEPSLHLAEVCRQKGFRVIEKFLEDLSNDDLGLARRCMVSFELFEHLCDPAAFLGVLHNLMTKDDLFIFSTLSVTGVDIQVLWEHSKAVSPPHHLNFFNPSSIERLLNSRGFEVLEITTPGKLDINILENNLQCVKDHFWTTFFRLASHQDKEDLQQYFSSHKMSSHMVIVCRKCQD